LSEVPSFDARLSRLRLSFLGVSLFRLCSSLIFNRRCTSAEISSVSIDVGAKSASSSNGGGWEDASRDRFEERNSSVISGSVGTGSFWETLRLFFRVFASVSVVGGGLEVDIEDALGDSGLVILISLHSFNRRR
jgi:hypothetical protein